MSRPRFHDVHNPAPVEHGSVGQALCDCDARKLFVVAAGSRSILQASLGRFVDSITDPFSKQGLAQCSRSKHGRVALRGRRGMR
jgi:hypothetical protein